MPGIFDIAPPEIITERFEFRGGDLVVRGLRQRELVALQSRFPGMRREEDQAGAALEAQAAAIAIASGHDGDKEVEAAIYERLTDQELQLVFEAIMRLTNPPVPLAESPAGAGQVANGSATTTPPPLSS